MRWLRRGMENGKEDAAETSIEGVETMRRLLIASLASAALAMGTAQAREPARASEPARSGEPERPVTQNNPNATDVATTPLTDLNLRKGEIPPLLTQAVEKPYDLDGLVRCPQIAAAIGELDAILGDDVDISALTGNGITVGRVAQSVVGSLIPFRGVIREVSGAAEHQRRLQTAIYAGIARRSFLKGVGQARGCRYPARSAPPEVIAQRAAEAEQARNRGGNTTRTSAGSPPRTGSQQQQGAK